MIVLDLSLPVMDGRQFRAAQLRDRSLAWIPVVLLSGDGEAAQLARQLGVRSFVRKPVDVDELRRALSARRLPAGAAAARAAGLRRRFTQMMGSRSGRACAT